MLNGVAGSSYARTARKTTLANAAQQISVPAPDSVFRVRTNLAKFVAIRNAKFRKQWDPEHNFTKLLMRYARTAIDWLIYLLVRIVICIVQAITDRACLQLSRMLAWVCADVIRFRENVIEDNLRHAFPEMSAARRREVRREMWMHLMVLTCEIVRSGRKVHETNWREHVELRGGRQLVRLYLEDQPFVIVTSHLGNFEFSGYLSGLLGFPTVTVARPLDNPFLNRFLLRFRQSTGQQIVSSRGTAHLAESLMQDRSTLAILGDHYGGPKGCWVKYFHRPASCHKSIGLLALSYQAKLIVVNTIRTTGMMKFDLVSDQPVMELSSESSLTEVTQRFTRQLENVIAANPGQYWWLHRRWKDTRQQLKSQRQRRRLANAGSGPSLMHPDHEGPEATLISRAG